MSVLIDICTLKSRIPDKVRDFLINRFQGIQFFGCFNYVTKNKARLKLTLDRKQWVLIQRYVTGSAGPAERQRVENWMAEAYENRRFA